MKREMLTWIIGISCFSIVHPQQISSTLVIDLSNTTINSRTHSNQRSCILRQRRDTEYWEFSNRQNEVDYDTDIDLKFSCMKGYRLSTPNPYSVCDKYKTRAAFPTCERLCPRLMSTSSTTLKCFDHDGKDIGCDSATDGSYATFTCGPDHDSPISLDEKIFCFDGRWNSSTFACEPVCGRKLHHIITSSDDEKSPEQYPWIAAIFRGAAGVIQYTCGGTVISEKLVLTAAHCIANQEMDDLDVNYTVVAGALYNTYRDPRDKNSQYLEVIRIITDPRRTDIPSYSYDIDIAILVTEQKIIFNDFVQPVCLRGVNNINLKPGDLGIVIGWGIVKSGDEPADERKILEIPYKSQADCLDELPLDWREKYHAYDKLCAGFFNQSRGVCSGDGGAGLIYRNRENDKFYIHGVVSLRHAVDGRCNAGQNALYTNVSAYADFVSGEMNNYLVRDCTLPPYPENGRWFVESGFKNPGDIVPSDTILIFDCNSGFRLSGSKRRIKCDVSYITPTCEKQCPPMPKSSAVMRCVDKNRNKIDCDKAIDGSTLTYFCPPLQIPPFGYSTVIHCVNGKWDSASPQCSPICGKKIKNDVVPLLYGATKLKIIEYPWVVALYHKSELNHNLCSGSIISYKLVLTAAHCVTNDYGDPYAAENYVVVAGKLYIKFRDTRDPRPQYVQVREIIPNENYRAASRNFLADIALLVTEQSLVFNRFVHPVCLQGIKKITVSAGSVGVVTGWGLTENNQLAEKLRQLEIPYKPREVCAKELPPDWENKYNLIDKVCAGLYKRNMSVCRGDSGSGLFYRNEKDGRHYVHGVVSLGVGKEGKCDFRYNSLYTNVSFHYDFVYSTFVAYTEDCLLPPYPLNGQWVIEDGTKKPGDKVSAETVLKIRCYRGFSLSPYTTSLQCGEANQMPRCIEVTTEEERPLPKLTCVYDDILKETDFKIEEFDTLLCDYMIYNSIGLGQNGHLRISSITSDLYNFATKMRKNNIYLKVLITVYGSGYKDTDGFHVLAGNRTTRTTFVESVVAFVETYNFDGVNIHWDAPLLKDRDNHGLLIKELKEKLKPRGLLLTASVYHSPKNLGYNHVVMYNDLDWINVECYDEKSAIERGRDRNHFESCAESWLAYSFKDKLSLGVAFFGRYYVPKNPQQEVRIVSDVNYVLDEDHTEHITYSEICQNYMDWNRSWDINQRHPYIYNGNKWIGYEDLKSVGLKVDYIKENAYFGATLFPINGDDVRGQCGPRQPLMYQVNTVASILVK